MNRILRDCIIENDRLIQNQSYYMAYSNIDTLVLLEETKGSNSLHWRRRWDSNPRNAFTFTRFPSGLHQPLGHSSKKENFTDKK